MSITPVLTSQTQGAVVGTGKEDMTKELPVAPTDLRQLAEEAQASLQAKADDKCEVVGETHQSLAAGLDRVRGQAVQRAKAANLRLRKQAFAGTAVAFGIGALLGFFGSRRSH